MNIDFESRNITRRSFLKGAGVVGAAGLLSACGGSKSNNSGSTAASGAGRDRSQYQESCLRLSLGLSHAAALFGLAFLGGLLTQAQAQFTQLLGRHRGRSLGQQAGGLLGFGEGDDVADAGRPGQQHDQTVQAESQPAVRRRALLQRLDQEAVISEAAEPTAESVPEQTVVVRQIGENIQLAEIKPEAAVFTPSSAVHRPAVSMAAGSQELPFRIRLPNGVLFEFMTPSPERSAVVLAEALR